MSVIDLLFAWLFLMAAILIWWNSFIRKGQR